MLHQMLHQIRASYVIFDETGELLDGIIFFNPQVKVSVVLLVPLDFRRHPELEETNCNNYSRESIIISLQPDITNSCNGIFFHQ